MHRSFVTDVSILLDALRRGRARETTLRPNPSAAQSDAVLRTLGNKGSASTAPTNRLDRLVGYFMVCVVFAIVLWAAVIQILDFRF